MECGVGDPWFGHIASGEKTVEGRLNRGKFAAIKVGTVLTIRSSSSSGSSGSGHLRCRVSEVAKYGSFRQLLEQEGVRHVLPGVSGVAAGVSVYRKFYSAQDEAAHGVLGLHLTRIKPK